MPPRRSTAAPATVYRLTRQSALYKDVAKRASIDLRSFRDVPKLIGGSNYNNWYDEFKIVCRQTGVIDFVLGLEDFPVELEDDDREILVEEYNNFLLQIAD